MIPNIKKINNRYRGPQESKKLMANKNMFKYNLKLLKERVAILEKTIYNSFDKETSRAGSNVKLLSLYDQIKKDVEIREGEICE